MQQAERENRMQAQRQSAAAREREELQRRQQFEQHQKKQDDQRKKGRGQRSTIQLGQERDTKQNYSNNLQNQNQNQNQPAAPQAGNQASLPSNVHIHRSGSVTIQNRNNANGKNMSNAMMNSNIHVTHDGRVTQHQQQQQQQQQHPSTPSQQYTPRRSSISTQLQQGQQQGNNPTNNPLKTLNSIRRMDPNGKQHHQQHHHQQQQQQQQYDTHREPNPSNALNFAQAMNSAKQKKQNTSSIPRKDPNQSSNQSSNPGYDWASATASSDLFQTSPKVQAHINEARQRRTQWELKDPEKLPEKSTEFVQNVKKDRFHRNASAPFATEQSLKIKLESSADLQQTLMNLGLERTQLEADIIRLEPKSRKKMDARLQKERMEIRLGVISKNSMTIKKKLREMGM